MTPQPPSTTRESLKPNLASTLLDEARRRQQRQQRQHQKKTCIRYMNDGAGIKTGCCPSIDAALLGGVGIGLGGKASAGGGGGICCISGAKGVGKSLISIHFLITYLLTHETLVAYVIDTLGTFDVLRLENAIAWRLEVLQQQRRKQQHQQDQSRRDAEANVYADIDIPEDKGRDGNNIGEHVDEAMTDKDVRSSGNAFEQQAALTWPEITAPIIPRAALEAERAKEAARSTVGSEVLGTTTVESLLERVRIIRVFDFTGLEEAVAEIGEELGRCMEKDSKPNEGEEIDVGTSQDLGREKDGEGDKKRRMEVDDSEEDDENEESAEMLLKPDASIGHDTSHITAEAETRTVDKEIDIDAISNGGLVVIDNITHVINPLIKRNFVHAQAKMATFFRNLSILSTSHGLCTMIINGAVTSQILASRATGSEEPFEQAQRDASSSSASSSYSSSPSIFPSVSCKPALGKTFPFYLDLHLFVNHVLREEVAQVMGDSDEAGGRNEFRDGERYAGAAMQGLKRATGFEAEAVARKDGATIPYRQQRHVNVLEVLADRYGPRVGEWAVFTIDGGVRLCDVS